MKLEQGQKAIADILGISERTLRTWLDSDDPPPAYRVHGVWCAFAEDLHGWIKDRPKGTGKPEAEQTPEPAPSEPAPPKVKRKYTRRKPKQ